MSDYVTRNDLEPIKGQLDRMENLLKEISGTLSQHTDAYNEHDAQLRDHANRIDKLERGNQNYFMDYPLH